ncbi:hypothetical protein MO867_20640 [Microbulbifer sp. OS29]|uniref:Uncharacterized protein n=1 Tax=Microbulbifer okhotskensis TaxID=2926617 RepID=A0A9X2EQS3_9GAMM|nr:hypothetical protein [Microbulbifer okhotskensis]MCO1336739.1 hypothetical protein [Microbulbifer okhotskensis]
MPKIRRRIGHFIKGENGSFDFGISKKDFNDECYDKLNSNLGIIFKVQPILISYESVELSYNELGEVISKCHRLIDESDTPDATNVDNLLSYLVEATQKATNFLSSATSFLCCASASIRREFGEKSDIFLEWDNYRKGLHSQNLSYRFLYEMRNYSQHSYLPIDNVEIKVDNIVLGEKTVSNKLELNKGKLLDSGYNWSENLKRDICTLEGKIDIFPMITEYVNIIRKISFKYLDIYKLDLENCFSYMQSLGRVFQFPSNSTPVIYIGETPEGNPVPGNMEFIPYPQFKWVSKHYFNLKP